MQTSDRPAVALTGSFARFVLLGGGVGLASSAAVPLVATLMPWVVANALVTVASTVLGTELHARFTFGTGRRAGWHQHVQSAGSATVAYLVTSAAVLVLHAVQPSAGMRWEQAVYLGASGVAGAGRFVVLRLYVFARGRAPGAAGQRAEEVQGHRPGQRGAAGVRGAVGVFAEVVDQGRDQRPEHRLAVVEGTPDGLAQAECGGRLRRSVLDGQQFGHLLGGPRQAVALCPGEVRADGVRQQRPRRRRVACHQAVHHPGAGDQVPGHLLRVRQPLQLALE